MTQNRRNYRIERYRPAALPAICELQQLLWHGGLDGNRDYFSWKYGANPYLDDRYVALAWSDTRLVGMVGAFGALWNLPGGGQAMLPCIADTVVTPDYRGSPLFFDLLEHLTAQLRADGIPWLLDFGDQPAGPAMMLRGWRAIGPWAVAAQVRDASKRHPAQLDLAPRIGVHSGAAITIDDCPVPGDLVLATGQVPVTARIVHVRDETFMKWRLANPLARHWSLRAGPAGQLGYLLAHRTTTDPAAGETPTTILDCEAGDDLVWADLLATALEFLPGREVLLWTRDLTPPRRALIEALGMEHRVPSGRLTADTGFPNLLVRATGAAAPALGLDDPVAWDLRAVCGRSWR